MKKGLALILTAAILASIMSGCETAATGDSSAMETSATETSATESSAPETSAPETSAPETSAPETSAPETSAVETSVPETSAPETSAPETSELETSSVDEPETTDYTAKYPLSNPNADVHAQKVYDYLCDNFGTYMLSCQQESTWMSSPDYEMDIIEEATGKLPAMRGLDFMNGDFAGVVKRSKQWHEKGGLVTICWHTGINGKGYNESLNDMPDFDKLLTPGTNEYNAMIANWDKAAEALAELRDAGIPVLWRPFHEFDGGWFWWGKKGGTNFIKLWQMMYDRYTNEFGLTNLIWVLGYSGEVKNGWYPGDDYCDIIGSDTYDNSTHKAGYDKLAAMNTGKPMAFHECGNLPRVDRFETDGAVWSWFMVWHTDYIANQNKTNLSMVYNSELVITLDELPKELFE